MHAFRSYIFAARIACVSGPTCYFYRWTERQTNALTAYPVAKNIGPVFSTVVANMTQHHFQRTRLKQKQLKATLHKRLLTGLFI